MFPELPRGKLLGKRIRTIRGSLGNRTFQILSIWKTFHRHYRPSSLISAFNASERSKTSQSRLTRWIDRLIPIHFDIRHLAGNKMGLKDYMSRSPVSLAKPPSEYDEEFVVASINAFINKLELIDNVILNNMSKQNKAQFELIKKRAKNKGLLDANLNTQLTTKHSKQSARGQLQTHNQIHFHSKFVNKQYALSHPVNSQKQPDPKNVNFIFNTQ